MRRLAYLTTLRMSFFHNYPTAVAVIVIGLITAAGWLIGESDLEAIALAGYVLAALAVIDMYRLRAKSGEWAPPTNPETATQTPDTSAEDDDHALAERNDQQQHQKAQNKRDILELAESRGQIDNNLVEAELDVSDATASRYLSELEEEGKLTSNAETGHHVTYKRSQ